MMNSEISMVGDIFIKGFSKNVEGKPALWSQLCFQVGVPTQFPAFRKAWFTFSGQPVSTAEGETFPQATVSQGTEEIRLQKFGISIRMTEEFIKSSPLNVVEAWLEEMGGIYQALEDGWSVTTPVSGDLSTGANKILSAERLKQKNLIETSGESNLLFFLVRPKRFELPTF
jgi:hypothetical protein